MIKHQCHVGSLTYGDGLWLAILFESSPGQNLKAISTTLSGLWKDVAELYEKHYFVSQVAFGDGKWVAVMNKGAPKQKLLVAKTLKELFPQINGFYEKGYYVDGLNYGGAYVAQ